MGNTVARAFSIFRGISRENVNPDVSAHPDAIVCLVMLFRDWMDRCLRRRNVAVKQECLV